MENHRIGSFLMNVNFELIVNSRSVAMLLFDAIIAYKYI